MSQTTIFYQIITQNGAPLPGITVNCQLIISQSWQQLNPESISTINSSMTNSSGVFTFSLTPQDQIPIQNTYYRIWYVGKEFSIVVPYSNNPIALSEVQVDPSTLIPVQPPSTVGPTVAYIPESQKGIAGGVVPVGNNGKINSSFLPLYLGISSTCQQHMPSATWTLNHNLGWIPSGVIVFDTLNEVIEYDSITMMNNNTVILTFSAPIAGYAIIG